MCCSCGMLAERPLCLRKFPGSIPAVASGEPVVCIAKTPMRQSAWRSTVGQSKTCCEPVGWAVIPRVPTLSSRPDPLPRSAALWAALNGACCLCGQALWRSRKERGGGRAAEQLLSSPALRSPSPARPATNSLCSSAAEPASPVFSLAASSALHCSLAACGRGFPRRLVLCQLSYRSAVTNERQAPPSLPPPARLPPPPPRKEQNEQ